MSEGPDSYEQWGVREWYRTTWSGDYPKADRIRRFTSVYDSIEDARWSLIYSTALQRGEWSQAGLLEHRQITGVNIGEDFLAFEIETGRGSLLEYVSANFLIRLGNVVIHLEAISDIGNYNPSSRGYARIAFFDSVWNPLIQLAHHADGRLLAELGRVAADVDEVIAPCCGISRSHGRKRCGVRHHLSAHGPVIPLPGRDHGLARPVRVGPILSNPWALPHFW